MNSYRNALCWAGATIGVAVAGMFDVIDEASTTTLLIALPGAWLTTVSGSQCRLFARGI